MALCSRRCDSQGDYPRNKVMWGQRRIPRVCFWVQLICGVSEPRPAMDAPRWDEWICGSIVNCRSESLPDNKYLVTIFTPEIVWLQYSLQNIHQSSILILMLASIWCLYPVSFISLQTSTSSIHQTLCFSENSFIPSVLMLDCSKRNKWRQSYGIWIIDSDWCIKSWSRFFWRQ